MKARLLLYGVDDYVGALMSRRAAASGFAHIAAGRDIARVASHANALTKTHGGLAEPRIFGLADGSRLVAQLDDVAVLVNCSAPFLQTAPALIDACLASQTHYVDLCATRADLAAVMARDAEAQRGGIALVPGANFDVAAADAMSARLATMLPAARRLAVAASRTLFSRAEAHDLVGACRAPGEILRDGVPVSASVAERSLAVDFGTGEETCFLAPWRCESLAAMRRGPYTAVESYEVLPPALLRAATRAGLRRWMFRRGMRLAALERKISRRREGPAARQLAKSRAAIWGEARAADGAIRRARLETPASHQYTADVALLIARILLEGKTAPGFRWPSEVGGAALVEGIEGVVWRELADPSETGVPDGLGVAAV